MFTYRAATLASPQRQCCRSRIWFDLRVYNMCWQWDSCLHNEYSFTHTQSSQKSRLIGKYVIIAARCDASARPMPSCDVCVSVYVCVTFVSCVKTNKDIFEIFSPSGSHTTLVFPYQTRWSYSDGNPLTGASNAGGVGKNAILDEYLASLHTGLQCYQPYESQSVKNKTATDGGERRALTAASVVRTRRRRSVCDGLDVIRRIRGQPLPDTTPLVITPVFCCRRTS